MIENEIKNLYNLVSDLQVEVDELKFEVAHLKQFAPDRNLAGKY